MSFERTAAGAALLALGISGANAHLRRSEETRRRASPGGAEMWSDGRGGAVEFMLSGAEDASRPLIAFESGLGAPMDSWDWLVQLLRDDYRLLRYHRHGYGRTRTRCRPAEILTGLVTSVGPTTALHLVGHSIGGLVVVNALRESSALRSMVRSMTLIDATDADLLAAERLNAANVRRFRQTHLQEALASGTGLSRWTLNPLEGEVNYRASIQKAFVTESTRPRTLWAALAEHAREPVEDQSDLAEMDLRKVVLAASDNVVQQQALAEKLSAELRIIPDSTHRSILGKYLPASRVAEELRRIAR